MNFKNALALAAIATFAFAQPAAAATRSYDSIPAAGTQQMGGAERDSASVQDADQLHGGIGSGLTIVVIFAVILAALAAGGAFGHSKSPG